MKFYTVFSKKYHPVILSRCIIVLGCCWVNTASAQIGRGCYVGGVLYTENTAKSNRHFYRAPGNLTADCGFEYTGTNDGDCRLYNSGNVNNNSSYTLYNSSFGNDWAEINCPIDDYVWPLFSFVALVGIFKLRSTQIIISS